MEDAVDAELGERRQLRQTLRPSESTASRARQLGGLELHHPAVGAAAEASMGGVKDGTASSLALICVP